MSFELAKLQIEAGMPLENIRDSVEKAYKAEDKETFDKAMREEYDALFPTYRPMIESEWSSDTDLLWSDLTAEDRAELVVVIDYSEDETYKTFEEYMNETRVVTEAVYEDEFVDDINVGRKLVSPEITEFVRPYVANDVTDKVDAYCNGLYAKLRAKEYPKLEDFADAWVKDDTDGMEAYRQSCLAVKAKYPKV